MKTGRIFRKLTGFVITIRNESFKVRICDLRIDTNLFKSGFVTYESIRIHGFAKRIHVFTNLLYESRILKKYKKTKKFLKENQKRSQKINNYQVSVSSSVLILKGIRLPRPGGFRADKAGSSGGHHDLLLHLERTGCQR